MTEGKRRAQGEGVLAGTHDFAPCPIQRSVRPPSLLAAVFFLGRDLSDEISRRLFVIVTQPTSSDTSRTRTDAAPFASINHAHVSATMLRAILVAVSLPVLPSLLIAPHAAPRVATRALVSCAEKMTDSHGAEIKAALSAYMHFCQERRATLTSELKASMGGSYKNTAVMSALGAEWKRLEEQDTARFAAVAAQDKARYDAAVASNPENALVKRKSPKRKSTGPKKLSAYMHFCADRRTSLTAELKASMGSSFKTPAVMSALGAEWRQLDPSSKARFEQMAAVPVE